MSRQPTTLQAPKTLGPAGRTLWRDLHDRYDLDGVGALITELCHTTDQLEAVKAAIAKDGLVTETGKAHPLLPSQIKLGQQLQKFWRLAGLSDASPEEKRGRGRPPGR